MFVVRLGDRGGGTVWFCFCNPPIPFRSRSDPVGTREFASNLPCACSWWWWLVLNTCYTAGVQWWVVNLNAPRGPNMKACLVFFLSETLGFLRLQWTKKKKVNVRLSVRPVMSQRRFESRIFFSRTPAAREAVPSLTSYDCRRSQQV